MLVSISDGFCLDGLFGAILFSEGDDMLAAGVRVEGCRGEEVRRVVVEKTSERQEHFGLWMAASEKPALARLGLDLHGPESSPSRNCDQDTEQEIL
jgi:hypothetical protein